jgi:hypothetical protein
MNELARSKERKLTVLKQLIQEKGKDVDGKRFVFLDHKPAVMEEFLKFGFSNFFFFFFKQK